jgi:spectinomycin phosphotransferase
MLEKPEIDERQLLAAVAAGYGLQAAQLRFLPLGVDVQTAVYRLTTEAGAAYFLKLRLGPFDPLAVALPQYLSTQGLRAVIAPLPGRSGRGWERLGAHTLILYPFIDGQDGYQQALTPAQWRDFGAAVRAIHNLALPPEIQGQLPAETYAPTWRERVRGFQAQAEANTFTDPVAERLAAFMRANRAVISRLVGRAEALAQALRERSLELTLCHADLHAGNLLLAEAGALYIVDWDAPALAPKERDLALIGGCPAWGAPAQADWFYQGYGPAAVDRQALAYYRCERAVQDIAAFCEQLLLTEAGGADREQAYAYLTSSFRPGGEVELAEGT